MSWAARRRRRPRASGLGAIGAQPQPQTFPIAITPVRCDLFPNASEKVHVEGTFTLAADSDGIAPPAEKVALRLFRPDNARVYPVGTDTMPFEAVPGGFSITAAAKQQTGIQDFTITTTLDPKKFGYKLVDTRTGVTAGDYSLVRLELSIGNDEGFVAMNLRRSSNGVWRLA